MSDERVGGGGVTVVVPHHGDPAPTLATIGDLRAQVTDLAVDVVVVDDCSPEPFPDADGVTVVRRETNGGFGSAVNSGAAVATQPLLLVLNSDVALTPTFVDDLVTAARAVDAGRRRPAPARPRGAPVEQRPALPHRRPPDRRVADPAGAVPPPARAARGGRPRHPRGGRGGAARRLGRRGRPAAAHRGVPRRRRLRRGLLHELRGGRPPAPAARARHPHGLRGHRGADPRRRRLVRPGRPAALARGVADALRRHLGWASPAGRLAHRGHRRQRRRQHRAPPRRPRRRPGRDRPRGAARSSTVAAREPRPSRRRGAAVACAGTSAGPAPRCTAGPSPRIGPGTVIVRPAVPARRRPHLARRRLRRLRGGLAAGRGRRRLDHRRRPRLPRPRRARARDRPDHASATTCVLADGVYVALDRPRPRRPGRRARHRPGRHRRPTSSSASAPSCSAGSPSATAPRSAPAPSSPATCPPGPPSAACPRGSSPRVEARRTP